MQSQMKEWYDKRSTERSFTSTMLSESFNFATEFEEGNRHNNLVTTSVKSKADYICWQLLKCHNHASQPVAVIVTEVKEEKN